jgi:hypothetical protein
MPDHLTTLRHLEERGFELAGLFPITRDRTDRVVEADCVMVNTALVMSIRTGEEDGQDRREQAIVLPARRRGSAAGRPDTRTMYYDREVPRSASQSARAWDIQPGPGTSARPRVEPTMALSRAGG